jgi:hypothetical protein
LIKLAYQCANGKVNTDVFWDKLQDMDDLIDLGRDQLSDAVYSTKLTTLLRGFLRINPHKYRTVNRII